MTVQIIEHKGQQRHEERKTECERKRERERVRERHRNKLRNITLIVVGASKNINQILALKQDLF